MDTKRRYALFIEERYGRLVNRAFVSIHAIGTLALGTLSAIMLVVSAGQMDFPVFFVPVYLGLSIPWTTGSFLFVPLSDRGMTPRNGRTFLAAIGMAIFALLATSLPVFGAMGSASMGPESGKSLGEFLACGVPIWRKVVAISP